MRSAAIAGLLLSAILSSGCLVASLRPIYDESSIEFDGALVGEWESTEDKTVVRVERGEWRSYRVSYSADGRPFVLTGFLTRIGEMRLLDLAPCRQADAGALLLPAHVTLRVQVLGDSLSVSPLDYDWFARETESGRLGTLRPVFDASQNVVLAAGTATLRWWLTANRTDRFGDSIRFVRRSS
jgi:hypothetical protein